VSEKHSEDDIKEKQQTLPKYFISDIALRYVKILIKAIPTNEKYLKKGADAFNKKKISYESTRS